MRPRGSCSSRTASASGALELTHWPRVLQDFHGTAQDERYLGCRQFLRSAGRGTSHARQGHRVFLLDPGDRRARLGLPTLLAGGETCGSPAVSLPKRLVLKSTIGATEEGEAAKACVLSEMRCDVNTFCFLFFLIFMCLTTPGLSCSIQNLQLQHLGSSSLSRDRTQAPCIGTAES